MNKWLKRAGIGVGGVVVLGLSLYGAASLKASSRLSQKFEAHRIDLPLPAAGDSAAVERGRHLVESRYGCNVCHGQNLGGGVMLDEPPVGRLLGPNLTLGKGGRVAGYAMADWDRLVRHGVKPDGTATLMPAEDFFKMSDAELSDIVAFLRALPPVDRDVPASTLGPVGKVLVAVGKLPLSAERQQPGQAHPAEPPPTSDSVAFGAHLAATCVGCHRENFAGGPMPFGPPDWPPVANLTQHESGMRSWSYEDFDRALTQGVSKDGRPLREPMTHVVPGTKAMAPTERQAMWTFLRSLKPTATNEG